LPAIALEARQIDLSTAPISFTVSHNDKRRQMDGQRSYCAALALEFFEGEAKGRQKERSRR
jgi:hypothetical protein